MAFFKFLLFCLLAIGAGLAAVSIPIQGRTAVEHLQAFWDEEAAPRLPPPTSRPDQRPPAVAKSPRRAEPPAAASEEDEGPTEDERRALDALIGSKVGGR
jgi:hypothetical protein